MQLDDGSTVTPGHSEIEESEHECMMTEQYVPRHGSPRISHVYFVLVVRCCVH